MIQNFPLSQAVVDILSSKTCSVLYAVELQFKEETVRAHTGTGDLVIDGQVYTGIGNFGEIASAKESTDSSGPMSVDLTLSGLDSTMIRESMVLGARGRPGRLMFVALSDDGTLAADVLFSGRMDAARFSFAGNAGESEITVPLIDRMAEWARPGTKRWNDESHRARFSGDRFFYAIAQLSTSPIFWGAKKDSPSFEYR